MNIKKKLSVFSLICFLISSTCVRAFALPLIYDTPIESYFTESFKMPIIMYHKISETHLTNKWTITPKEFENDLAYLKEHGFNTIFMSDLIAFVHKGTPLPEKPIILTFDDGDAGVYTYALPLLQKYDMKAVLSIIGKTTDDYSAQDPENLKKTPHLKWVQINELLASGHIEIQNHSYDLHKASGAKKRKGESNSDYHRRLSEDLTKLQERIFDMTYQTPTTFVYPFGAVSDQSKPILQDIGFLSSLGCYNTVNTVTEGDTDCLFNMCRLIRPHGHSTENIFGKLLNLYE